MPPIDPNNPGAQQPAQSLLDLVGQGADPYGGKTLRDIVRGGLPYAQDVDMNNNPYGGGADAIAWQNQLANNQNVSQAIAQGGQYQPDFARAVESSGAGGGWFSIPSQQPEGTAAWGLGGGAQGSDWGANPAPGLAGMSTNNWRLLPQGYQDPSFAMRAGHVIDRYWADKPMAYASYHGAQGAPFGLGGPGHGYPVSIGSSNQRDYFFPGQLEPWFNEGGPGTT